MSRDWLKSTPEGLLIEVLVVPRASRTQICGEHDGRLKIQVAAPPVEGEANRQILKFLCKILGLGRGDVSVESGDSGRRKRIRVEGMGERAFLAALGLDP